jgi:hypothetical protein
MQLIDPNHPFYRPLWRRVVIVGICLGWAAIEGLTSEPVWALMVGGLGIYAGWMLLLNYNPQVPEAAPDVAEGGSDAEKDGD